MRYETNSREAERGIQEIMKIKINNLELLMDLVRTSEVRVTVEEYYMASELARSIGVDTMEYDDFLIKNRKELRDRFGVKIK